MGYSYEVISTTISIFAAVMFFQICNGIVEGCILEPLKERPHFKHSELLDPVVDFTHMLFWFIVLQVALAWISGAIGKPSENMNAMLLNLTCGYMLLAHLAGFASINAWGSLQQLSFFKQSPLLSFSVVPLSITGQFMLQRITDSIRWRVALSDDGVEDEYEKKWDEFAE